MSALLYFLLMFVGGFSLAFRMRDSSDTFALVMTVVFLGAGVGMWVVEMFRLGLSPSGIIALSCGMLVALVGAQLQTFIVRRGPE